MSKGKIIKHNVVIRKKGFLYYIDKDGNLCEAKMILGSKPGRKYRKFIPSSMRTFSRV